MKKEIFKEIITNSFEKSYDYVQKREIDFPIDSNKIISFIGVRRSGKTHLMYHAIKELRNNFPKENILYFNFEDDRIFPINLPDLSQIIEAYYELLPEKKNEKVFFFFDEIQVVENWEKFIRRVYDTENCQIFISGSSSNLLSSEIATSLRGRTLSFEVFPLSFSEYLRFQKIDINFYSSKNKAKIINLFQKYMKFGGFPELIYEQERFAQKTLQEYIDLIIYKDLIERYKISNRYLLKYLVKYCFTNTSTLLSSNKLYNDLKSQGIQLSKNTLYNYMEYLQEAYAVFSVPVYSRSISEQSKNPKKIYAIDTGFKTAVSTGKNYGQIYETIVYLQLRRKHKNIFYWKSKQEIDFIYQNDEKIELINVSYNIDNAETYNREINGLLEGMQNTGTNNALLITAEKEGIIEKNDKKIYVLPLWKWLLQ